jgi:uncharacterized membrane protein
MSLLRALIPLAIVLLAALMPRAAHAHMPIQLFQGVETYESGVIVEIPETFTPDAFARMPGGLFQEPPQLQMTVELLSGVQRGQRVTVEHNLFGNPSIDVDPRVGERVIVAESRLSDGRMLHRVVDYDRRPALAWVSALSVLALLLVGRQAGLKTLATVIAVFGGLYAVALPLLIHGVSPIGVSGLAGLAIGLLAIRLALGKGSMAGRAAMLGMGAGLVVTIAVMAIAYTTGHVSGLATPDALVLYTQVNQSRTLDYRELWLAGALLTTLGGLIMASLVTARAIAQHPEEDAWEAGLREGRKVLPALAIGTGLLYFGLSLSLLLITRLGDVTSIKVSLVRLFNYDYFVSVMLAWESGLIGMVATLLATAWSGRLLRRRESERSKERHGVAG